MYWPLGTSSVYAVPTNYDESPTNDPLISLSRSVGNLFVTLTATELFIWQSQVLLTLVILC